MEKINEEYSDEINVVRKSKNFPPYFYKSLTAYDDVVTITRVINVVSIMTEDPCYAPLDITALDNHVSLSNMLETSFKWQAYCGLYSYYKVVGVDITGCSLSTDSPFSGAFITRITYPPLALALVYTNGIPEASYKLNDMAGHATYTSITPNFENQQVAFVIPESFTRCATWNAWNFTPNMGLFLYFGGKLNIAVIEPVASEAYQVTITVHVALKDRNA